MRRLEIITYLAPSIPAAFFELVASDLEHQLGILSNLRFEERISGPLDGDEDPFESGSSDIGFLCAPSYRWLRSKKTEVELLPLPVPDDPRARAQPVYFSDVIVRSAGPFRTFESLRGARWAYNDRNSQSGWFSMISRVENLGGRQPFFRQLIDSGSHLRSLDLVRRGLADAAAIDSNALRLQLRQTPSLDQELRVIESWGPFPIQPVIVRSAIDSVLKDAVASALLSVHERFTDQLAAFGMNRFSWGQSSAYETEGP